MTHEITHLLAAAEGGDPEALSRLIPLVYDELRNLAVHRLAGERRGHTLQPTALVHETYLRLFGPQARGVYHDRRHFYAAAATAMRRILIDSARRRKAKKRGGGVGREALDGVGAPEPDEELLALDVALTEFAALEPEKARLVELRYFAGLTADEAAGVLGISPSTADRHWSYARAWLHRRVRGP